MVFDLLLDGARSAQRRDDQVVLRAEMVDEGVDAHAERGGHRSERHVGQSVLREVGDDAVEQLRPAFEVDESGHGRFLSSSSVDPAGRAPARATGLPGVAGR